MSSLRNSIPALLLSLACATPAWAQNDPYPSPSLLPAPVPASYVPAASMIVPGYAPPMTNGSLSPASAALTEPSADDGSYCGDCGTSGECCTPWFVSIAALAMTRDNPNAFWTSYETNNNPNQVMNTKDASADWRGGGEVTFGKWCCCGWGIEIDYFTLSPFEGYASVSSEDLFGTDDGLSTPIDLGFIDIGGDPASDFFDNAAEHRIWRNDEIQNVEINILKQQLYTASYASVTWLAGVRFFRFDESLTFGSVAGGFEFGQDGGIHEAYLGIRSTNNLIGFQVGVRGEYYVTNRISLFAVPKIGIFGNEINNRARLYRGDGLEAFDIRSNEDDLSILAELQLGAGYDITDRLRGFFGYRVIAVSRIALADNQIPAFLAAADEFADIDTNGNLLLHGGFAGLEYQF